MIYALICLATIAGIWWILEHAPTVDPTNCPYHAIKYGHEECGGPCATGHRQPCQEED